MLNETFVQQMKKTRLLLAAAILLGNSSLESTAINQAVAAAIALDQRLGNETGILD